jgi:thymidylate synthase ThyX
MTIEAKIILDSISDEGIRLTTVQLRYPRFIHAELMTHRVFSRNASSSRAIPVERLITDLRRDPAMPVYWGSNKPGMQAGAELSEEEIENAEHYWLNGMETAIDYATSLADLGLHKQIANRILEPWAHINVVVTSSQWENFFALRSHPDAQPEMKALSDAIKQAMHDSVPSNLSEYEWHLPYVLGSDWEAIRAYAKKNRITRDEPMYAELAGLACRVSVARCARVSYLTHDGRQTTIEEDIALHDRLVVSVPLHASPAEHQACPDTMSTYQLSKIDEDADKEELIWTDDQWDHPEHHGNLNGWRQYRKMLGGEFVEG